MNLGVVIVVALDGFGDGVYEFVAESIVVLMACLVGLVLYF